MVYRRAKNLPILSREKKEAIFSLCGQSDRHSSKQKESKTIIDLQSYESGVGVNKHEVIHQFIHVN